MMIRPFLMAGTMALCLPAWAAGAPPDAGELLKAITPRTSPVLGAGKGGAVPEDGAPRERELADAVTTVVRGFRLRGASLLPQSSLEAALAPFIGHTLGLTGLQAAAAKVMQAYREKNHTVFAFLPPQDIVDGIVEIDVIEGRLSAIEFDAGAPVRFDTGRARRYIEEQLPVGAPIDMARLERALLLLNDLHGVRASASLDAGREAGETRVVARLADEQPGGGMLHGGVAVSNGGARSTGELLTDSFIRVDSPARRGDQAGLRAIAGEGLTYLRADYQLPIGYDGWRLDMHAAHFRYRLIGDLAASQTEGRASEWGVSAAYPIVRTHAGTLNAVASFADRSYLNTARGQDIGNKRVRLVNAGLSGGWQDGLLGYTGYGLVVESGRLEIADAASAAADEEGPQTAGSFVKLAMTASRRQNLALSLDANLSAQLASKNLDSSEKLYLGGPAGVRAYPVSEGGGDNGWMLNLDLRYRPVSALALSVFADTGTIRQYRRPWPGQNGANNVRLSGAGLALDWERDGWSANITVAWRIGDNPLRDAASNADTDGTRRIPRFWMRLGKAF